MVEHVSFFKLISGVFLMIEIEALLHQKAAG